MLISFVFNETLSLSSIYRPLSGLHKLLKIFLPKAKFKQVQSWEIKKKTGLSRGNMRGGCAKNKNRGCECDLPTHPSEEHAELWKRSRERRLKPNFPLQKIENCWPENFMHLISRRRVQLALFWALENRRSAMHTCLQSLTTFLDMINFQFSARNSWVNSLLLDFLL